MTSATSISAKDLLLRVALISVISFPIDYAFSGVLGLACGWMHMYIGLTIGIVTTIKSPERGYRNLNLFTALALLASLYFGIAPGFVEGRPERMAIALIASSWFPFFVLSWGCMCALSVIPPRRMLVLDLRTTGRRIFLFVVASVGVILPSTVAWIYGLPLLKAFAVAATTGVLSVVAGLVGYHATLQIERFVIAFTDVMPYLNAMGSALGAFLFGYAIIAFVFGGFFAVVWRLNPAGAFRGINDSPPVSDFYYFAFITLTTVGYGDIIPISRSARILACSEVLLGFAWATAVLAGVLARAQRYFVEIDASKKNRLYGNAQTLEGPSGLAPFE